MFIDLVFFGGDVPLGKSTLFGYVWLMFDGFKGLFFWVYKRICLKMIDGFEGRFEEKIDGCLLELKDDEGC